MDVAVLLAMVFLAFSTYSGSSSSITAACALSFSIRSGLSDAIHLFRCGSGKSGVNGGSVRYGTKSVRAFATSPRACGMGICLSVKGVVNG